jgi:hypothetical protein
MGRFRPWVAYIAIVYVACISVGNYGDSRRVSAGPLPNLRSQHDRALLHNCIAVVSTLSLAETNNL